MLDLRSLPKAHLHLHLEAGIRAETLAELAARYGVSLPSGVGRNRSWAELGALYAAICAVLKRPADIERVIDEVVEDNSRDGVVWLEPTLYAPAHAPIFGDAERAANAISGFLQASCRRARIAGALMLIADRQRPTGEAEAQALLAARMAGNGVVSFGIANLEVGYPLAPFRRAFDIAHEAGLICAPHAGEMVGAEAVVEALEIGHARRIEHGITAVQDPALVSRLASSRVCLDICPTSNVALGFVPSLKAHPLPELLRAGVRCSLNADDPVMFGVGILDEYRVAHRDMGLTTGELADIAENSLWASGAPAIVVETAIGGVRRWREQHQSA